MFAFLITLLIIICLVLSVRLFYAKNHYKAMYLTYVSDSLFELGVIVADLPENMWKNFFNITYNKRGILSPQECAILFLTLYENDIPEQAIRPEALEDNFSSNDIASSWELKGKIRRVFLTKHIEDEWIAKNQNLEFFSEIEEKYRENQSDIVCKEIDCFFDDFITIDSTTFGSESAIHIEAIKIAKNKEVLKKYLHHEKKEPKDIALLIILSESYYQIKKDLMHHSKLSMYGREYKRIFIQSLYSRLINGFIKPEESKEAMRKLSDLEEKAKNAL